jgi:membrane-associated protein
MPFVHCAPESSLPTVDRMIEILESAITSPWVYVALFAIAVLDGFFPVVPSETMVITAGVFAAGGEPELVPVIAVAALGAFIGDHISYEIGRRTGPGMLRRLRPGGRRRAAFDWAANTLAVRGGLLLVVARYVPGGRTVATMTTGAVGYSRRKFALFGALAASSWGLYSALVGYLGGAAFEHDKLKGLLFGLGLAATITMLVELARHLRRRRARHTPDQLPEPSSTSPAS